MLGYKITVKPITTSHFKLVDPPPFLPWLIVSGALLHIHSLNLTFFFLVFSEWSYSTVPCHAPTTHIVFFWDIFPSTRSASFESLGYTITMKLNSPFSILTTTNQSRTHHLHPFRCLTISSTIHHVFIPDMFLFQQMHKSSPLSTDSTSQSHSRRRCLLRPPSTEKGRANRRL